MTKDDDTATGIDGYLFRLIATFEAAAMQQLGKIAHPVTGDVEVILDGAKDSIEMLDMVRRKTDGNLNDDERRLLEHVLYQLRMNYVDVTREEAEAGETDGPAEAQPTPDAGSADARPDSGGEPDAADGPEAASGEDAAA